MKYEELIGDLCVVEFLDHAMGFEEPPTFRACGWLVDVDDKFLKFETWQIIEGDFEESNHEWFHVLKAAVTNIKPAKL